MAPTSNEDTLFLVKRHGVNAGSPLRDGNECNIDLRARDAARGCVCIDSHNTQAGARHFLGKNLHESRQVGDLTSIRYGERELSRRRRRVEGITLNDALELAQRTLERWCQSCSPGCRDNATATADDERIAKFRAQTRERVADRGRRHVKSPCRAHDAPLREHRIEHPEQVQIESR